MWSIYFELLREVCNNQILVSVGIGAKIKNNSQCYARIKITIIKLVLKRYIYITASSTYIKMEALLIKKPTLNKINY